MEFIKNDHQVQIISHKKSILLEGNTIDFDGMKIDTAGEYEKSGLLLYVNKWEQQWMYQFQIEGYRIGYIPQNLTEIDDERLDFLGQLDILLMPAGKSTQKVLESIDPRMIIAFGDTASEVPLLFGDTCESVSKYKLKALDISPERTTCVILGSS